jgi:hypothetical protein
MTAAHAAHQAHKELIMKPVLNTLDIVVTDVAASIAFYRRLGLDFQVDPSYAERAGCDCRTACT